MFRWSCVDWQPWMNTATISSALPELVFLCSCCCSSSSRNLTELRCRTNATGCWRSNWKNFCASAMAGLVREEIVRTESLHKLLPTLPSAVVVDLLSIGVRKEALFKSRGLSSMECASIVTSFLLWEFHSCGCWMEKNDTGQLLMSNFAVFHFLQSGGVHVLILAMWRWVNCTFEIERYKPKPLKPYTLKLWICKNCNPIP